MTETQNLSLRELVERYREVNVKPDPEEVEKKIEIKKEKKRLYDKKYYKLNRTRINLYHQYRYRLKSVREAKRKYDREHYQKSKEK